MQEVCGRWGSKIPFSILPSNQKQKCLRGIVRLFFYGRQKSSELDPVLDTMRRKLRGISAKCVYRLQPSRNGTPDRSSLPPSHARTASKKKIAFGEMSHKCFKFPPKKDAKTAGVEIAGLRPRQRQTNESSHEKAGKKGSVVQSDTVKYILRVSGEEKCIFCAA